MGRNTRYNDSLAIIILILLSSFGLFLLLTINMSLFWQQLFYVVLGAGLFFFISKVDVLIFRWFAPVGYVIGNLFLLSSYLGPTIRGAKRWIVIGGSQIQPSELVKPLLLFIFAYFITKYPPKKLKAILFHVGLFIVPFFFIFRQPDLGTSLVYAAMWLAMMVMGGLPLPLLFGGVGIGVAGLPLIWRLLADYQKSRIFTFLDPLSDPRGSGYNAIQAMIAVGSGEFFGRGLGLGTQSHLRFLPEYFTDFMFATLVEELGFVGGALLLVLYGVLLWRLLKPLIAGVIHDRLAVIYTIGLFTMLLTQIVINSGMNMGILPVTGITLPLVSYGGSSILSIAISFGILWAIAFEDSH
ncbi:MAG: FtsW/RodA/SpoVE family cell cycle protein [Candidatus Gottesmanbacteria bacterium]